MRKITRKSLTAFLSRKPFSSGNMSVSNATNATYLLLHGNVIAILTRYDRLYIRDAGWQSNTTKERLDTLVRAAFGRRLYQKGGRWYLVHGITSVWDHLSCCTVNGYPFCIDMGYVNIPETLAALAAL